MITHEVRMDLRVLQRQGSNFSQIGVIEELDRRTVRMTHGRRPVFFASAPPRHEEVWTPDQELLAMTCDSRAVLRIAGETVIRGSQSHSAGGSDLERQVCGGGCHENRSNRLFCARTGWGCVALGHARERRPFVPRMGEHRKHLFKSFVRVFDRLDRRGVWGPARHQLRRMKHHLDYREFAANCHLCRAQHLP